MAAEYSEAARKDLEKFPENEFKRALLWIPDFVVAREK
jgi:octaprenyl-diphosphate synthase